MTRAHTDVESARDARRRSADRGVSTVVGALLMFGLVMVLLVSLQATAVPAWNKAVEFEHDSRVQNDVSGFHDDILRSSTQRTDYSTTVSLGVRYPTRPFLLNPPDPSGHLRTLANGSVTLSNATASGEAGDYLDGTPRSFTTRTVVYRADYNEYRNAPRYLIDNGGLIEQYRDEEFPESEPMLVDGRRITLVLVQGPLSEASVRDASVMTHAVSPSVDTTVVSNASSPVEITVPTAAGRSYWQDALGDELDSEGGYVVSLEVTEGEPYNTLRLELQPGVDYRLRTAAVSVGGDHTHGTPHYLTRGGPDPTTAVGQYREVEFVVRDRFTNPVAGVDVRASVVDGPGEVVAVDDTSDDDGTVRFQYVSERAGTATIRATFGSTPGALETAERSITVDGGATAGVTDGCTFRWTDSDRTVRLTNAQEGCTWAGVESAGNLSLSNPTLTSLTGANEEFDPSVQYFRLGFTVENNDTTYYVAVTRETDLASDVLDLDGLERSYGGSWSNTNVQVYRRVGDQSFELRGEGSLNSTSLEAWYQGNGSLDLLDQSAYDSGNPGVDELQTFMSGRTVSVRFLEFHGRTTIEGT